MALSDHDDKDQVRSITPEVDPDKLANFDQSKQKISALIVTDKQEVGLEERAVCGLGVGQLVGEL